MCLSVAIQRSHNVHTFELRFVRLHSFESAHVPQLDAKNSNDEDGSPIDGGALRSVSDLRRATGETKCRAVRAAFLALRSRP